MSPDLHDSGQGVLALILLALVTFAIGLAIPRDSLQTSLAKTRAITLGSALQWLLLPIITAILIHVVPISPSTAKALWLVAATPGGYGLLTFALLARSDLATAMGLSLISTVLKLLLTPLLWWVGTRWLIEPSSLPMQDGQITRTVFLALPVLLLPLIAGIALQNRKPQVARALRRASNVAIVLLLLIGIAQAAKQLLIPADINWLAIGFVVALHHGIACLVAAVAGASFRCTVGERRSLVFACGTFNASLAVPLALVIFPGDATALLTLSLWVLWRLIVGSLLALLWRRGELRAAQTSAAATPVTSHFHKPSTSISSAP
ncbi:MAG: bile acid:sodium symporter [Pseudomonadota bacterium]